MSQSQVEVAPPGGRRLYQYSLHLYMLLTDEGLSVILYGNHSSVHSRSTSVAKALKFSHSLTSLFPFHLTAQMTSDPCRLALLQGCVSLQSMHAW